MSRTLAQVTCPNCKQPFTAPLEQVLDVEIDPSVKPRLLAGQANIIVCPSCGAAGVLDMPFIYHDPAKELALVLMPMEAGRDNMEQQRQIGALSRAVMSQMPPEQRKGYLLNPQVFFSLESLINRVLEADGITPEMLQAQRDKIDLLRTLVGAAPEERLALVQQREAELDAEFFYLLGVNANQAGAMGQEQLTQQLLAVRDVLYEHTETGRRLRARSEAAQALQQEPTREKLVELFLSSNDPETRALLVTMGQALVDYMFFQAITQKIETTTDAAERGRLEGLRQEVLDIRQNLQALSRQAVEARVALLQSLMATEQPELLARRHLAEMDDLFFNILSGEIERLQQGGDEEAAKRLQSVWQLAIGLIQERMPPELALLTQIMEVKDGAEVQEILKANARIVTAAFVEMLEQVEKQLREREETETAERAAAALVIARRMAQPAQAAEPTQPAQPPQPPAPPAGGLLIAKR